MQKPTKHRITQTIRLEQDPKFTSWGPHNSKYGSKISIESSVYITVEFFNVSYALKKAVFIWTTLRKKGTKVVAGVAFQKVHLFTLKQWSQTQFLEGHSSAEFSSNSHLLGSF